MAHPCTGLTAREAETLALEGVVRVPGAIPRCAIDDMAAALWRRLEARYGAVRDRPATWTVERPAQLTSEVETFSAMDSPRVRAILDDLLGAWIRPPRWGVPLAAFPGGGERWDVPHRHWHLDLPASADAPRVARLFAVLAPSGARGGATGYVAGSHRVLRQLSTEVGRTFSSAEARRLLAARSPWFAALETIREGEDRIARFMDEGDVVDGVEVRVREMLGEPGDLFVMDPAMLHAMTPNALDTPRLMLTAWVYGEG